MIATPGELTRCLVAPATAAVDPATRQRVTDRLRRDIAAVSGGAGGRGPLTVSLPVLRRLEDDTAGSEPEPFAWRPSFVRRSLGLAAVEACLDGRAPTPAEAVAPVAEGAVAEWERSGWRTFHWEPWYSSLAPGARAQVLAQATTWASGLWSSLDWGAFPSRPRLGGPDDGWAVPGPPPVRLRARVELRTPVEGAGPGGGEALVSVGSGLPGDRWEAELGYLALVALVRSAARPAPVRVVGMWPDAGEHRVAEVTEGLLDAACDLALDGVGRLVGAAV